MIFSPINEMKKQAELAVAASLTDTPAEAQFVALVLKYPAVLIEAAQQHVKPEMLNVEAIRSIYSLTLQHAYHCRQYDLPLNVGSNEIYAAAGRAGVQYTQQMVTAMENIHAFQQWDQLTPELQWKRLVVAIKTAAMRAGAFKALINAAAGVADATDHLTPISNARREIDAIAAGIRPAAQQLGDVDLSGANTSGIRPMFLPFLSRLLNGFKPGGLYLLAARSGVGKSMLSLAVGLDAAVVQRAPVLYLDSEMSREEVTYRALSNLTGIDENQIRGGICKREPAADENVQAAMAKLKSSPFYHVQCAGWAPERVLAEIERFVRSTVDATPGRKALVALDYLKAPSEPSCTQEWIILGTYAQALKEATQRFNVPILCGVQSSRAALGMDAKQYADGQAAGAVGGSDRLLHNADVLLMLRNVTPDEATSIRNRFGFTPDAADPRNNLRFNQVLHLLKQRSGPDCTRGVPVKVDYGTCRYHELASTDAGQRSPELEFLHSSECGKKPTYKLEPPEFMKDTPPPVDSSRRIVQVPAKAPHVELAK